MKPLVAFCKNIETGQWFEYDDSRVREIEESKLISIQAYLLFYIQKIDTERCKQGNQILLYQNNGTYNRVLNSINPGPIDSFDVTCSHGQLNPKLTKNSNIISIFLQVLPESEEFCEQLRNLYGEIGVFGILEGPEICSKCIEENEALKRKSQREDEEIQALDIGSNFNLQHMQPVKRSK